MFALVFWLAEKQFSVVQTRDIVLSNGQVLEAGIKCPVKWRERRSGRRVEELFEADIKAISENNEELELLCIKMAEELDEKSQASLDKDTKEPRKRKRTEKGRSWDETVEHETVIAKKLIVDQPSERGHSSTQAIVQEETSLPKETVSADKPGGKSKKKTVRQPPTKQNAAAAERKEKEKSNETRSLGFYGEKRTAEVLFRSLHSVNAFFRSLFTTAYAKRCASVWKIADQIDFTKTIRNKRGSAKRRYERQLMAKKENVPASV